MLTVKLYIYVVSVLSSRFLQCLLIFRFNINICLVRCVVQKTNAFVKKLLDCLKLWKLDLIYVLYKYLVRPSCAFIRKTSRKVFRKITIFYCKNHTENFDTFFGKDTDSLGSVH